MPEKIGEDVLFYNIPISRMPKKKRKELEQKLKEALAKAKKEAKEEELKKLPISGEKIEAEEIHITEAEAMAMLEVIKEIDEKESKKSM